MLASSYFLPLNNFSRRLNSRGLVDDYYLTCWHRLYYCKLPQPYTFCRRYSQILSGTLFYSLVFSLYCIVLIVICEKYCEFSIFLIALIYRFVFLLDIKLWKVWRILPLACNFNFWFGYICWLIKLYHLIYNF